MSAKKIRSEKIEKSRFDLYLKKASDFYRTMIGSYAQNNWNSVGLSAVHCVISATDALLTYKSGIRSTSQKHSDIINLLKSHVDAPGTSEYAGHLSKVINLKNLIEYEARNFTEKEAEDILKHTERYFHWIRNQLPK